MSIPFKCSNTTTDVCSYGLIPINNQCIQQPPTIGDSCVCQGPWQHDFMWAHIPNCMMPSQLPLAMCIVSFILSAISIPVFARLKLRSSAKEIQIYALIAFLLTPIVCLVMFLQGGIYEVALLLMIPQECLLGLFNATLVEIFLKPLLQVKSISRVDVLISRLRMFKYSCLPIFAVIKFAQMPFAQDTNVGIYNAIWVADMFLEFVIYQSFNTGVYFSVRELQKSINDVRSNVGDVENSPNNFKYVDLSKRLQKVKLMSVMTTFTVNLPVLVVGIVFAALGYFPMLGIINYGMLISSYGATVVLRSSLETQKFTTMLSGTSPTLPKSSNNKDGGQQMAVVVNDGG
jgi:hypothetical protein